MVISLFLVLVAQQGGFEVPGKEAGGQIISTHAAAFGCGFGGPFHGERSQVVAFLARGFLVDGCGELRGGVEEFLGQREKAESAVVPLGDALEAELVVGAVLGG